MKDFSSSSNLKLNDFIAIGWRHKWKFAAVFVPIFAVTLYMAIVMPAIYRSKVTLVVEAPELPKTDVTATTDGGYVEARLASIEKRILSSSVLSKIAIDQGMLPEDASDIAINEMVQSMRNRISREAMVIKAPSPRAPSTTVSFSLFYEDENPKNTKDVANKLGELYIEENSRLRINLAQGANSFLKAEADRIKEEIAVVEGELATFKKENFSALPENVSANLNQMDQADLALERLSRQIQQLEQQLIEQKRQLSISQESEGVALIQEEIDDKKLELSRLQLRFEDAHPDIIELKSSIKGLENQLASTRFSGSGGRTLTEEDLMESPTDDRTVLTLKSRIKQTLNELAYNKEQQEIWQAKQQDYQTRLNKSPEVEQQYQRLVAHYNNLKGDLDKIDQKQMAARLSLKLERERKSERFSIIEPATLPTSPYKPNRPALMLLGFVLALGAGVMTIALGERFSSAVNGPAGVIAVLKEPPLAIIPVIGRNSQKT